MQGASAELGPIVNGDRGRQATGANELFEERDDRGPADGSVDMVSQALPGEVIDQRETAKAPAAGGLVANEVHAPALVGRR